MIPNLPTPEKPPRFPKITLIKELTSLWRLITNPKKDKSMKLKPGVTTTEFWIVIAAGACQVGLAAMDKIDAEWAAGGITILGGIYVLIRGGLKSKPPAQ